jgi:hypothetical protein
MQTPQTEAIIIETSKCIKLYKQCITNFTYANVNSFIIASSSTLTQTTMYPQYNKKYSKHFSATIRHSKSKQKDKHLTTAITLAILVKMLQLIRIYI